MTMDELNTLYNNMSVYGDTYTPPITTIPTDPNAGQPPILEPLIPALPMQYINQNGDGNNGITTLAPDYGYDSVFDNTNITPTRPDGTLQPQTNFEYDIEEGSIPQSDIDNNKTSGIAGLLELLQKISPMANIMKLGKTGIETAQKYFADKKETERLEALAQIEQAKKQTIIDAARKKQMQDTGVTGKDYNQAANIVGGGGGNQLIDTPAGPMTAREATYDGNKDTGTNQSYSQHYARGGRTGYGKGGIVSL